MQRRGIHHPLGQRTGVEQRGAGERDVARRRGFGRTGLGQELQSVQPMVGAPCDGLLQRLRGRIGPDQVPADARIEALHVRRRRQRTQRGFRGSGGGLCRVALIGLRGGGGSGKGQGGASRKQATETRSLEVHVLANAWRLAIAPLSLSASAPVR
ncbi:hypothetical protein GCM10009075_04320 [Sphingomonas trueperi]